MYLKNKTFERLKEEAFSNAIRLFEDSCILYKNKSYPSSYALSVLAEEEIGKLNLIDHICDDICLNGQRDLFTKNLFLDGLFYNHTTKQQWSINGLWSEKDERNKNKIYERKRVENKKTSCLEIKKQNSIYVDYKNGHIITPEMITQQDAYSEIKNALEIIVESEDLAFNGFQCISTRRTKQKAQKIFEILKKRFNKLVNCQGK